ncbi:MAG: helix-turn-helix transcriptional regulator [Clostridiales bacterium]
MKNRISELRKEMNMSTSELANLLSITMRTIQRYEKGVINPTPDKLKILAKLFNCSIDYILCLTDLKHHSSSSIDESINVNLHTKSIFIKNLKDIMIDKEITKETLSINIQIEKKELESFINGSNFPSIDILKRISKALNTTIDFLVGVPEDSEINKVSIGNEFVEVKKGNTIKKIPKHLLKDFLDLLPEEGES